MSDAAAAGTGGDKDLAQAEETLGKLTQLLEDPRMDMNELRELLEQCNDVLQATVAEAFGGRSEEVELFLEELMMAQLEGEDYCRVDGEHLKDVVQKLRDIGVLDVSPEDESLVRIAL